MDTNKPSMKLVEAQKLNENHFPLAAMWGQLIFLGSHVLGRKLNHHVDVSTYKLCNNFTKLMIRPRLHGRPKNQKKKHTQFAYMSRTETQHGSNALSPPGSAVSFLLYFSIRQTQFDPINRFFSSLIFSDKPPASGLDPKGLFLIWPCCFSGFSESHLPKLQSLGVKGKHMEIFLFLFFWIALVDWSIWAGLILMYCFWVFVIYWLIIPWIDWGIWGVLILMYVLGVCYFRWFWWRKSMVDHHHHGSERSSRSRPRGDSLLGSCCCPFFWVSATFRGIGRCMFVSCYPIIQCFGWDDCRHHHHRHFWIYQFKHSDPTCLISSFFVFDSPVPSIWLVAEKTREKDQETCRGRRRKNEKQLESSKVYSFLSLK